MLRNLAAIVVLGFRLDDLRAESGGVSDIKGSDISSGETRDVIFFHLGIFYSRVRSVADNFLGALVDFDFKVSRSGFVEVSLGVRTSFFPLVSVVGKGSALGRTMVGFIVVSVSFGWLILDTSVVTDPIKTLFGLLVKDTL